LRNCLAHTLILLTPLILFGGCKAEKAPTPASKATAPNGEALFKENCAMCHNTDSTQAKIGPGLRGLFKNKELPTSHKPTTEANVRQQILQGSPNGKPMPMPAFAGSLKPEEIDSLIQYLKTL
jgi:mono/diheme cytochrome c family protein